MNLAAVLEARAAACGFGDRPALVVGSRTLSHDQVHLGAAQLASLMADHGVGRGDAVLIALADGAEWAWAFLGAARLGAVAVPVNPQLPASDHRHLAADCQARAVVCSEDLEERFAGRTVLLGETLAGSLPRYGAHPPAAVGTDDAAYAQYTSGTTGSPRAAVHGHGDPLVYAAAFAEPILGLGPADVVLSVSKMYFAYGLGNSLFFPLLSGAQAVLLPGRPCPEDVTALVHQHRVTVLFAVPTFFANLVRAHPGGSASEPAAGAWAVPFPSLRVAVSAGEALTTRLAERTARLLGCPVLDSLGSTEVGQAFVSGSIEETRAGAIGRALPPYEVAVRDDDGRDRSPGVPGMLWVRGPTVLREYLGQPEAAAAAMDGDWLRTGDLASLDDDGFLFHHGRADDLEMVGGITVAPQEIEELLSGHPAVSEVAVAVVAEGDGPSRLRAFVVPAAGVTAGDELAAELTSLTRAHLAAYKVPRSVRFVDALPRTPTGKLRRFVLRSGAQWSTLSHAR